MTKAGLICQPPSWAAIERRRRALGVTHSRLLAESQIHRDSYFCGRAGRAITRGATLRRLWAALDRLEANSPRPLPPSVLAAFVAIARELFRHRLQKDERLARACRLPRSGLAAQNRRLQSLAIYLATVEFEVANATLARALGCERQNIHQLRAEIEELRDHPRVDRLFDQVAGRLRGTA